MLLGCIADDFTGASDLANMLAQSGMSTTLCIGVPEGAEAPEADAVVVALKSRSAPAAEAVAASLAAARWLAGQGCRQLFFKYCSTFDSTPEGNIGPVLDALAAETGAGRAVVVPAFPATGRRVFMGHLFVADALLSRSGMEHHPLNPMTESDIRLWLGLQTRRGIGHVDLPTVRRGREAIATALDAAEAAGRPYVVVDTCDDEDLRAIGAAVAGDRLVSGGSGLALGLPANFGRAPGFRGAGWRPLDGRAAALAGSCSRMTLEQVRTHAERAPLLAVDPEAVAAGRTTPRAAADWVAAQEDGALPLVASSMSGEALRAVQARLGRAESAALLERFFGALAQELVAAGVERLIVAGGETSGAVVSALGLRRFAIGPEIAPGVPALASEDARLVCTLKSGNFGDADFFARAAAMLAGARR